ncbi:hypothetical protein WT12_06160 [Burkholderia territorii]|nr:hypothetical protein WT12_06160 [Burkholderia territorii]
MRHPADARAPRPACRPRRIARITAHFPFPLELAFPCKRTSRSSEFARCPRAFAPVRWYCIGARAPPFHTAEEDHLMKLHQTPDPTRPEPAPDNPPEPSPGTDPPVPLPPDVPRPDMPPREPGYDTPIAR